MGKGNKGKTDEGRMTIYEVVEARLDHAEDFMTRSDHTPDTELKRLEMETRILQIRALNQIGQNLAIITDYMRKIADNTNQIGASR